MKITSMLMLGVFTLANGNLWATAHQDSMERLQMSSDVLHSIMEAPDKWLGTADRLEGVDLVMLVMNDQGFQHLLSSKFQISGDASAAAGPVGRHASAGTDWKLNTEILTYSRSRGAFAGITLNGAVIQEDNDSTLAIYGRERTFQSILSGKVRAPKSTLGFMKAIAETDHAAMIAEANPEKK